MTSREQGEAFSCFDEQPEHFRVPLTRSFVNGAPRRFVSARSARPSATGRPVAATTKAVGTRAPPATNAPCGRHETQPRLPSRHESAPRTSRSSSLSQRHFTKRELDAEFFRLSPRSGHHYLPHSRLPPRWFLPQRTHERFARHKKERRKTLAPFYLHLSFEQHGEAFSCLDDQP